MSLIEDGALELSTPARSVLGSDLPAIDDGVTVEHLLSHRSGIGDYFDEEAGFEVEEYVLPVPVHELATTEDYLAVLEGHASKFAPGERFAYCNGGYVVLALIAERASGVPFYELVEQRVCRRAGLTDTAFLRSDELPARTALGYVEVDGTWRSNVFHLPVRGSGDGGIYSTAADLGWFWRAFFAGGIVSTDWVSEMVRPRSDAPKHRSATGWASGSTRRTTRSSSRDTTQVSRSGPCTTHARVTLTVISNTARARGRSFGISRMRPRIERLDARSAAATDCGHRPSERPLAAGCPEDRSKPYCRSGSGPVF